MTVMLVSGFLLLKDWPLHELSILVMICWQSAVQVWWLQTPLIVAVNAAW